MDLKKFLEETTFYEKKEKLETKKIKNWLKSVSAFANSEQGGIIFFGINDDEQVVGLDDYNKDANNISEIIKTHLDPIPNIELKIHNDKNNKKFIVLKIIDNFETPYYISINGTRNAYKRLGNQSVLMI